MNYFKVFMNLLIAIPIAGIIILATPAKWLTVIAIVIFIYNFILYYDKIRLLWVAIPMAQEYGAKLHYHEDLRGWVVLDQKDNHLWTSAYWTKLGAAIAYLKQYQLI